MYKLYVAKLKQSRYDRHVLLPPQNKFWNLTPNCLTKIYKKNITYIENVDALKLYCFAIYIEPHLGMTACLGQNNNCFIQAKAVYGERRHCWSSCSFFLPFDINSLKTFTDKEK